MGIRRALALTAIGLSGAGVLGVMLYPSRAAAFVRETTNYATGTPLAWSTGCIQMAVGDPRSSLLSWADLTTAVTGAADTWTQGSATCGGGFRLTVADAQRGALSISHDGVNAVVFTTSNYCGSQSGAPRCDPLSLASTALYFVNKPGAADDGRIYEADIEINGEAYHWGLAPDPQTAISDLQSAITHELGHVLGLEHNCYPGMGLPRAVDDQGNPVVDCGSAPAAITSGIMYPQDSFVVVKRDLTADDVGGICSIYPSPSQAACAGSLVPRGGDGCSVTGEAPGPCDLYGAAAGLVALCFVTQRRRRAGGSLPFAAAAISVTVWLAGCSSNAAAPLVPCTGAANAGEVCIPGGVFVMGHDRLADSRSPPLPQIQLPAHHVKLDPFFLDVLPVTNGEYKSCLVAGICPDECQVLGVVNSLGLMEDCQRAFYQAYHVRDDGLARYPVATIYDTGAEAYCASIGKRLPTEAEWERAARGPGNSDYPWGNAAPDCTRYDCSQTQLTDIPFYPVGTYPVDAPTADRSPEGVRLLVTGVQEFLHDWYYSYPFDNGEPIPNPQGTLLGGQTGQNVRGNTQSLLPHYKGDVSGAVDPTLEPFPLPAWARDNRHLLAGGFRCARDDK